MSLENPGSVLLPSPMKLGVSTEIFTEGGVPLVLCLAKDMSRWRGDQGSGLSQTLSINLTCMGAEKVFDEIQKRHPEFQFSQTFNDPAQLRETLDEIENCILHLAPSAINTAPAPQPGSLLDYDRMYEKGSTPLFHCEIRSETDFFRAHSQLVNDDLTRLPLSVEKETERFAFAWVIQGAGKVRLLISPSKDVVVLLKTFVTDETDLAQIEKWVSLHLGERFPHTIAVPPNQKLAVFWSPLDGAAEDLSKTNEGIFSWPGFSNAGAELELSAGTYELFCGDHEESGWTAHWLTILRVDYFPHFTSSFV